MTHVRRRGYLTLVITAVPKLRIFDFQCPVVRLRVVDRPESLVVRVRVTADRQQMYVSMPHPGNLKRNTINKLSPPPIKTNDIPLPAFDSNRNRSIRETRKSVD